MLTTTKDANGKLCLLPSSADSYGKRTHCLGDKCMAWRWISDKTTVNGYCGLAGRPLDAEKASLFNLLPELAKAVGLKKIKYTVPVDYEIS